MNTYLVLDLIWMQHTLSANFLEIVQNQQEAPIFSFNLFPTLQTSTICFRQTLYGIKLQFHLGGNFRSI